MSRLSSQLRFNDLTGGINNVYDKEMINSSTKKTETPDMVNVEYFQLGGIKTMEGNTLVGGNESIQKASIVGGWEYTKNSKKYMIIGLSNGEVRRYNEGIYNGNKFELIYTFKSISDRMSFCNMNNGVVITNGIDDLVFYEYKRSSILHGVISTEDGSSIINGSGTKFTSEVKVGDGIRIGDNTYYISEIYDASTLIVDKPITSPDVVYDYKFKLADTSMCNATLINTDTDVDTDSSVNVPIRGLAIQYYKGRLYVGTKQGLFYSPIGEYNNWNIRDDAGVFYDIYNDSSEVTALGLYSDYMLVHKKFNTYMLSDNGSGKSSDSLSINPFSNITCDSQQSWIVSNTKYYVYSKEFMDIYPLVQRTIYNDRFLGEPITQKVRELFKDVNGYNAKNIFCVSRPKQRQMIFYLPTTKVRGSGEALIFDFQTKSWLLRRLPKETTVSIAFNFDNNVYIGTEDGMVLKEFSGNNFTVLNLDDSGDPITEEKVVYKNAKIKITSEPVEFHNWNYSNTVYMLSFSGEVFRGNAIDGWSPTVTTSTPNLNGTYWYTMTYDGKKLYGLSYDGYISYTLNNNSYGFPLWKAKTKIDNLTLDQPHWNSVVYNDIKFIAIEKRGYVSTSYDFDDWSIAEQKEELASYQWMDLCNNGNSVFAISSEGAVAKTEDGDTWEIIGNVSNDNTGAWYSIAYGDGKFIALSRNGYISTSINGIDWSEPIIPQGMPSSDEFCRIRFCKYNDNGYFLVINSAGPHSNGYFAMTYDGTSWTTLPITNQAILSSGGIYGACYLQKAYDYKIEIYSEDYGYFESNKFRIVGDLIEDNNYLVDYFYKYYNPYSYDGLFNFYKNGNIMEDPVYEIDFEDQTVKILVDLKTTKDKYIKAYYKSPWFDWAGNYYQSFSEFFIEVNSDYRNKFIIRTQKDGTSRYEDRLIDENKFVDKTNTLVWDDESKHWGGINEDTGTEYKHDNWSKITFDTLRMLLPNSVFESFQFEFRTDTDNEEESDKLNRGFHIYQYGFRRIETEEAPW